MKKIVLLFFLCTLSYSQNVSISLHFEGIKDSTKLYYSKSFDGNPSHFVNFKEETVIINNVAHISFSQKNIGRLVTWRTNEMPYAVVLPCKNGDVIDVFFKKNNDKIETSFVGSNAEGLEFLNNSPYFLKLNRELAYIFIDGQSSSEIIEKIEGLKNRNIEELKGLLTNNKISKDFFEFVKLYQETEIVMMSYLYLDGFLSGDESAKISQEETKRTIQKLDSMYNVFDEKYSSIKTNNQYHNIINKCKFISQNILVGKEEDYKLWDAELKNYNFCPKELQEFLIYYQITKNDFDFSLYNRYKRIFPNGIYIKVLRKQSETAKRTTLVPGSFTTFNGDQKKLKLISNEEFPTITDLLKSTFKSKAVFVDIWATWCSPCKDEFKYSDKLTEFLKSQNIELLYLTIDNAKAVGKWSDFIVENKLYGNHYFTTTKLKKELMMLLNIKNDIMIPRYLLFNDRGELILEDAKRPSQGQKLYDQIITAIK
ncbi:TlpA family protein disulfide reductase [Flavobacterium granuli]|uniref:Redoxin n=1 Tax=Flavobacterium granuli TaxID=280093 RepID=A0A1M5TZQ8_9FLAO|nr:redoxin family protein [Flavobacterium granuli]PRZ22920.1 redoxin [Flavobacterium granuli]SHH56188.1 Redoxin [Flavobacterium granuli]